MIDQLGGPSCVAEMTGRKGFIGRHHHGSKPTYMTRSSTSTGSGSGFAATESVNVQEVREDKI